MRLTQQECGEPPLQDQAVEELARAHTRTRYTISLAPTKHTTMTYFSHTSFYHAYYLRFYKLIPKTDSTLLMIQF